MEAQIVSAVQIAFEPYADQNLKQQAFEYVNQLRKEPSAWQPCLTIFTSIPRHPDVVRIFALDVVNDAIHGGFVNEQAFLVVKDRLMNYLQQAYQTREGSQQRDPAAIENKIAQTITFLFSVCYAESWKSFFPDLLGLTSGSAAGANGNAMGTLFYLRVINSIHDEFGDQVLSRSRAEQDWANTLKDLIRERDVERIAQSWQSILREWGGNDDVIAELCIRVVSKWVSWVDISLVVNEQMLDLLFPQLARAQKVDVSDMEERARHTAIDVFTEITAKKMKASDKLDMMDFLNLQNLVAQLSSYPPLAAVNSPQYDIDLAETVAKLVNTSVVEVVKMLESEAEESPVWQRAENALQIFLPHLLRFFSDEYDEVCSTVIPSMNDVLTFLRKSAKDGLPSPQRAVMLLPILKAIFGKMRYDETFSGEDEDEGTDEAEFLDLRKRLDALQQSVAATDEELFMDSLSALVEQMFDNLQVQGSKLNWRDLELALHEMYLFGDTAARSGGLYQKNKQNSPAAERLICMMHKMVESDIRSFNHPATQLQYMEICVRYGSFFEKHQQYITRVLENFLQFARHPSVKVKTRSWYLFQRFVRLVRLHISNIAESVVQNLNDLLVIRAELPPEANEDDASSEDLDTTAESIFNSQLYLFEAIGTICGASSVAAEKQAQFAQSVMQPIFSDIEANLPSAKLSDERAVLQIHHDIMALGTLVRGYSDSSPGSSSTKNMPAREVQAAFGSAAEATLVALESVKASFNIRTAARFTFSRLIAVLGSEILPTLRRWIDGLLVEKSSRDEIALFLHLLDQVIFGFKNDISTVLDSLFTGLLQRVFSSLSLTTEGTDDEIQLAELKREYLNFLLVLLSNDLGSVIVSTANQPLFETVVSTIEHFTKDVEDFPTAKMAFQVFGKMCSVWGGPDVVPAAGQTNGVTKQPQPTLPGLDRFMITRLSPLCWVLPANPAFNGKDAQARQVLGEVANLQKVIYTKTGPEYVSWLRDNELRATGMNDAMINEYLGKLTVLDQKGFRIFFQNFVSRARN